MFLVNLIEAASKLDLNRPILKNAVVIVPILQVPANVM